MWDHCRRSEWIYPSMILILQETRDWCSSLYFPIKPLYTSKMDLFWQTNEIKLQAREAVLINRLEDAIKVCVVMKIVIVTVKVSHDPFTLIHSQLGEERESMLAELQNEMIGLWNLLDCPRRCPDCASGDEMECDLANGARNHEVSPICHFYTSFCLKVDQTILQKCILTKRVYILLIQIPSQGMFGHERIARYDSAVVTLREEKVIYTRHKKKSVKCSLYDCPILTLLIFFNKYVPSSRSWFCCMMIGTTWDTYWNTIKRD